MFNMHCISYYLYPLFLDSMMILFIMTPSMDKNLNPINLSFTLIMLTSFISFKLNLLKNSWGPFILFLTVIGGLMVIFLYIVSLASNNFFTLNFFKSWSYFFKFFTLFILMTYLTMNIKNYQIFNTPTFYYNFYSTFNNMFLKFHNLTTIFIINYLVLSMVCIMNICFKFKAPLRQLTI